MPDIKAAPEQFWRFSIAAALILYLVFAALLIAQKPGLHYDEALLVVGSVQMHRSAAELPINHPAHSWIRIFGRSGPLMSLRYAGAVKDYLFLPMLAALGPRTALLRLLSTLLGAIGLWGLARLICDHVSAYAGGAAALILAINPTYVSMTVFDNGTTSVWIAVFGLTCLALSRYLKTATAASAFWLGAAAGCGVWARANFLWIIAAVFFAALLILRRRLLRPFSHYAAAAAGALLGGLPFLLYQAISGMDTWQSMTALYAGDTLGQRLFTRIVLFSEMLVTDREHRAMWDPARMVTQWQRWFFPVVVLASCAACLAIRNVWARISALAFIILGAILFASRLTVSEHHLVALLPFAVVLTVLACAALITRYSFGGAVAAGMAVVYLGCALYWQGAAIRGLHRTGGVGQWSDGLIPLATHLEQTYHEHEIELVDWGLGNNIFVVTNGRLRLREVFWGASTERSGLGRPWMEEIRDGGVFVLNAPAYRRIPAASQGFLKMLDEAKPVVHMVTVPQRNGSPYAEIYDIEPNTIQTDIRSSIVAGDARFAHQLRGFYQIEEGQFRWTGREFSINLRDPENVGRRGARLTMELFVPDSSVEKLGAITLAAHINNHALDSQTYARGGSYVFQRDINAAWLNAGANRFDFRVDKVLPPSAADGRELGIVVMKAALEPR